MKISDLQKITHNFTQELKKSQKGEKTSLAFIANHLSSSSSVKNGEIFQVMVVGGSIFQEALVKSNKGRIIILKRSKEKLPQFTNEAVFLTFIEKHIDPKAQFLAINFAQALQPFLRDNKLDGILLNGSKEHLFTQLLGKAVGKTIEEHIQKMHKRTIHVHLANDTICLLLSGLTKYSWNNLACGIVGTGLNFSLFSKSGIAINLESGAFDKFRMTPSGTVVDANSLEPGKKLFEKEIAGAYLFQHFNYHTKNLFTVDSTKTLSHVIQKRNFYAFIAKKILTHSANLVACQIAGITNFQQQDMTFIMQGSLFWKGHEYKKTVEETLKQLIPAYKVQLVNIEHADIVGAAKLVA